MTTTTGLASEETHVQGLLFEDETLATNPDIGFRQETARQVAGISYRQLDYWARTGLVEPSVQNAHGSGTHRLYSFRDILFLKVVKRLLDTGVSLQKIRVAATHLHERGVEDLAQITMMSDGKTIYECTSDKDVIDLVHQGQGVFGIAVGAVWREVEVTIAELPVESFEEHPEHGYEYFEDELAARRARKAS